MLLHGLLLIQRMHVPLARALAQRGNRVVTLDLLGHGRSERPPDMWRYGMGFFAQEVVGLLDHLGAEEAIVDGTSLGANATLEVASLAPERLRGMVVEMPVLDNALLLPEERLPWAANVLLDTGRQDSAPTAAVLQGLFFGRTAPHRAERRTFTAPTLVIGHHRDPVHPFSDAGLLAQELPNARLLEASSIVELRVAPERLTSEIAGFVDECWRPRAARNPPGGPRLRLR